MTGAGLPLAAAFAVGTAAGALYFALLWRAVRGLTAGGGWRRFALAGLGRTATLVTVLVGALALGAAPGALLVGGLGFLVARAGFVARVRAGGRIASGSGAPAHGGGRSARGGP